MRWLISAGLVFEQSTDPPTFSYRASPSELDTSVEALAYACVEDWVGVLHLMSALAIERMRLNLHKVFASTAPRGRKTARVWVLVDGKKHTGAITHSDKTAVVIREEAKPGVVVLRWSAEGTSWGIEEDT